MPERTGADWTGEVRRRLATMGSKEDVDASVVEELAQHLEDRYAELRAAGVEHAAAMAETLEELADEELAGERLERARPARRAAAVPVGAPSRGGSMGGLWNDLRYGVRLAVRQPAFTIAVVLTLALGIGATTAIFSVINTILLREPPFADIDKLVMVWETDRDSDTSHEPASWPDIVDFRERARTLTGIGALLTTNPIWLRQDAESERLTGLSVTADVPELLGVRPLLGTTFDRRRVADGERLVLLGEQLWRSRLGADPAVIGSTLRLDGAPATVVGVLPTDADLGVQQIYARADYGGPFQGRRVDVWIGMAPTAAQFPRQTHPLLAVGRLAQGASIDAAQRDLAAISSDLEAAYPENKARGVHLESLSDAIFGPSRPALLVLMGAVALVLLITCANVANLMMARILVRRGELSVRSALGARRSRVASQLLMETLVLTGLGGALGLALAYAGVRSIVAIAPGAIPRIDEVAIDWTVLAVLSGVTLALTLVLGALPMRGARWADLRGSLQQAAGRSAGRGSRHGARYGARALLVVSQTALAVALVVGAGILLRSFVALLDVDPGFQADAVVKAEYQLPPGRYTVDFARPETYSRATSFFLELLRRVRALPGVEAAALARDHPLQPGFTNSFQIVGREAESADFAEIRTRFVSPSYQATLGVPLHSGRTLSDSDDLAAPRVGVLNQAAAERYFPHGDAVGQVIRFWGLEWHVVGVMGDEHFLGVDRKSEPAIYGSLLQMPIGGGSVLVRSSGDPATVEAALRSTLSGIDPQIVPFGVETMDETLSESVGRPRFVTTLTGMFAVLAILVALVGLHGVLSYSVSQRASELGIRKAFGASGRDLERLVLGDGLRLALLGVALGLAIALAGSRALGSLVFGVSAADPLTFAAVTVVVLGAALLASWLPARRASATSPLSLLRSE